MDNGVLAYRSLLEKRKEKAVLLERRILGDAGTLPGHRDLFMDGGGLG